jgi:hypothetical protein
MDFQVFSTMVSIEQKSFFCKVFSLTIQNQLNYYLFRKVILALLGSTILSRKFFFSRNASKSQNNKGILKRHENIRIRIFKRPYKILDNDKTKFWAFDACKSHLTEWERASYEDFHFVPMTYV